MANRYPLTKEEVDKIPATSGVYTIYTDRLFPRLNGETDIVYIGMAKLGKSSHLKKRLMSLVTGKGRNAYPRFSRLQQVGFKLSFSYEQSDNPRQKELEELKQYEERHLELPPLNRSGHSI